MWLHAKDCAWGLHAGEVTECERMHAPIWYTKGFAKLRRDWESHCLQTDRCRRGGEKARLRAQPEQIDLLLGNPSGDPKHLKHAGEGRQTHRPLEGKICQLPNPLLPSPSSRNVVDEQLTGMAPMELVIDSNHGSKEQISIILNGRSDSMIHIRGYGVIFAAGDFVAGKIPTE
jgi:hypothetical protein